MEGLTAIHIIIFSILSIPIFLFSRRTIFNVKSHGFYRFFSWECILWLLINNYRYWFFNPLSTKQILSWLLLIYSLVLVIFGFLLMKNMGKPQDNRKNNELFKFEKTTELIETGLFKYIRHPMYGSLLFLTWGIFFKNTTNVLLIVSLISSVLLYVTAKIEEKENIEFFGEDYSDYMKRSKMFIPFIF
ncbi:isoprenylcysteine carboxylmethyltransferase family protein [bacterium]|nr:isoprenylcysteine carboxylmethyltransferase family protein [bacterium]